MNIRYYVVIITALLCCNFMFSQSNSNKQLQVKPYAGVSLPQGNFKELSKNGTVFGIAMDKYLSKKFALGIDFGIQSNSFNDPVNSFILPASLNKLDDSSGKWNVMNFTFGPSYKMGTGKLNTEVFVKAGFAIINAPNLKSTLSNFGGQDIDVFDLKNEKHSSLAITSGIRFNYVISKRFSLFLNPQYVFNKSEIEYFHRDVNPETVLINPDVLLNDAGALCYIDPSYANINFGATFSFGGGTTKKPIKNDVKDRINTKDSEKTKEGKKLHLLITSHEKGKRIKYSEKDKSIQFKWEVYGNTKKVKSYKLKVYQTDFWGSYSDKKQLILNEISKKKTFNFKPVKMSSLSDDDIHYYFEVVGLDASGREITNDDGRDVMQPARSRAQPRTCFEIEITEVLVECATPAYDQTTGWINYTGKVTILNTSNTSVTCQPGSVGLDADLSIGAPGGYLVWYNNTPGVYNTPKGFLNGVAKDINGNDIILGDWEWDYASPNNGTNPTPTYTIPPGLSQTVDITLRFRTVPLSVNFGVFSIDTTSRVSAGDSLSSEEIPNCICEPCETYDVAPAVTVNTITLDNAMNPSHSILNVDQTIFAGSSSINNVKAELVYFEEILPNDPLIDPNLFEMDAGNNFHKKHLCQICNAAIDGLGIFNGNVTINNQGGSSPNTRTVVWYFNSPLNMTNGTESKLQIGVPKVNPLACCKPEYKFSIRYTFENEECKKCDVVIDYHYQ